MYAMILWKSALGLEMGKFRESVTELSAINMIMTGYYRFYLIVPKIQYYQESF